MPETAQLRTAIAGLESAVNELAGRATANRNAIRRDRRLIVGLAVSLLFDVVLTAALTLFGVGINHNQARLDELQRVQSADTAVNHDSQCAFMKIFFQSEPNIAASTTRTTQEKAEAAQAFTVMHKIADELLFCGK